MAFLYNQLEKLNKKPIGSGAGLAGMGQDQVNPLYNSLSNMGQKSESSAPYQFKQPEQFSYDAGSDPQLANALQRANASAKTATNNAMVGLGARGIGNSSIAVDRGNQIQQAATSDVYTNMLPQFIQQAYQRYQDTNNNQFRTDTANYNVGRDQVADNYTAGRDAIGDNQWQQTYDANRTDQADNLAINKANLTGNYENPDLVEMLRRENANSAAYANASPEERARLHLENQGFAKALGQTYNTGTGKYSDPITTARTMAGQTQDSNKQQSHIDLAQKLSEMYGVHVDPKNDPALAYKQVAGLVPLNKQKQDFDQKDQTLTREHNFANDDTQNGISQQNANTSTANSGNSASDSKVNQLFETWKARGTAPAGLESLGVKEGTAYAGQTQNNQPQTAETYSKYLDSIAQYTKDDNGTNVLSNPDSVESAILTSGMSEYEMFRSYKAKGLPWSGPIPTAPGK